jgi:hypothetical protein
MTLEYYLPLKVIGKLNLSQLFSLSALGGHSTGRNSILAQAAGRRKGNQRISMPRSMGNTPILLHSL